MLPALAYADAMRESEMMLMPVPRARDRRNRRTAADRAGPLTFTQRQDVEPKEHDMRATRHLPSLTAALALSAATCVSEARAADAPEPAAILEHLRRHRARHVFRCALHREGAAEGRRRAARRSERRETLAAARDAWKAARVPYQQTEGFRFGNSVVDDWEGKVNAWPLDEGLIDYVDADLYGEHERGKPALRGERHRQSRAAGSGRTRSTPRRSRRSFCPKRCRRRLASKPTSRPATMRSSSCSGGRICTAPGRAPASGRRPTTTRPIARTATATGAATI